METAPPALEDIAVRLTEAPQIEAGQEFIVDRFRPVDAAGLAGLFLSVYGNGYPIRQYYDPEWLAAANASNELVSVVARTAQGAIVSHMAALRSAAENPKLYELGVGLTLPQYRGQGASRAIARRLMELLPSLGLDGAYGEAVCNHTVTQKIAYASGYVDTAVETDLMPAEIYGADGKAASRVSCLFSFLPLNGRPPALYVPEVHREAVRFILQALPDGRAIETAPSARLAAESRIRTKVFGFAAVSRCYVMACGEDIAAALERAEQEAEAKSCTTRQAFLALADPGVGRAAAILRDKGYSLGGLAPCWFVNGDGLLLQRLMHAPGFAQMELCDDRARQLVALAEADWRAVNGVA
jgi:hypothetical protein